MDVDILSLFPEYFSGPFDESILKRARQKKILNIHHVNIRDFSEDKHHRVDDRPFGGGPGMVLMAPPIQRAIGSVRRPSSTVVYLSPQGEPLTAKKCQELAAKDHLVLLCGHYEGIDERVLKEVDEEISIGDYVLTNGALPAIVLIDAVARFIPGVLGHGQAANEDSFQNGILDCPHYTRPEVFEGTRVPEVLLGGNHGEIAHWRREEALKRTQKRRPDLYYSHVGKLVEWESQEEGTYPLESKEVSLECVYPAKDLKMSAAFYRKVMGFQLSHQSEEAFTLKTGASQVTFIKGEPKGEAFFKLKMAQNKFEWITARLLREKIEKLQTKAGEIIFQDLNNYVWIIVESTSFKGEKSTWDSMP